MVMLKPFLLLLLFASAFSIYRVPVKVNRKMPKEFANKQALADYFEHVGKKYKNLDGINFGINNTDAIFYTLNITIGSPPQNFNVTLLDMMADTWIPCKNATYGNTIPIDNHNLFDCDKSTSCKKVSNNYSFQFLNGDIMSDVLCLGNGEICTNHTQTFGCVTSETPLYHDVSYDGFLGLGFVSQNSMIKSVTDQFFNNKVKCPQPVYSLWLNPDNQLADGEFIICGVDTDLYQVLGCSENMNSPIPKITSHALFKESRSRNVTMLLTGAYMGNISWTKLLGEDLGYRNNYWQFELDEISVNGYDISGTYYTLIDMYLPFIGGPRDQVPDLAKAVGAVPFLGIFGNQSGFYMMECNMVSSAHNITITLSGQNFVLTPDDYIIRVNVSDNGGMEVCILGIATIDMSMSIYDTNVRDSFWMLGDNFIRKFYTVFEKNDTNSRVGFAQAKN